MAVLYQKFRPQRFEEVKGQEPIVQTLRNAAKAGELSHAYLFTGSRGVGKTTIARLLAKAANCQNLKDGDPCGKCEICTAIANGSSLDVIEIDAASHTGVDNVRELIEHAQFRPTVMRMKVFIIDEVHMLSKAAFNALLKTLEEPPAHVMFILATTDIEKVPDTIVSRTQRFDFKRIGSVEMAEALAEISKEQKLSLPEGVIEAVVAQAEGSMRDALSRLDMVASLGNKMTLEEAQRLLGVTPIATVQELVSKIINHDSAALPEFFEKAMSAGSDPAVFNRGVLQYLRLILNAKLTGNSGATDFANGDAANDNFQEQVKTLALPQLLFVIRLFLRSYKELAQAPSPDLPLLLAAVEASLHGVQSQPGAQAQSIASASPKAASPSAEASRVESGSPSPAEIEAESAPREEESKKTPEQKTTAKSQMKKATKQSHEEEDHEVDASVTLEEIQRWWPEVVSKVKVENSPIATLLKNSPVIEVENGKITVAVKYLFHKEHLDNKKHSALITEAITAVSGKRLGLRSVIKNDSREPTLATTVDALSDALKVFGGELVE